MTDDAARFRLGTPVAVHVVPPRVYPPETLGYRFECSFEHLDVHPEGRKVRIRISPCLENCILGGDAAGNDTNRYKLSRITKITVSLAVDLLPETAASTPPRLNFEPPATESSFPVVPAAYYTRAESVSLWDDAVTFNEHYSAFSLVYSHRTRSSHRTGVGAIRCRIVASASRHWKVGGDSGPPELYVPAVAATVWFDRAYRLPQEASK